MAVFCLGTLPCVREHKYRANGHISSGLRRVADDIDRSTENMHVSGREERVKLKVPRMDLVYV